jgi:LacI family transcriptional regulator
MAMLMAAPRRPTAVVCGNDVLALGAVFECAFRAIDVPGEVSITGFDDLDIAAQVNPPLTTMRVPSEEMGRRAAEYLLDRLDERQPPERTRLDVTLVERGTTGPVPAGRVRER